MAPIEWAQLHYRVLALYDFRRSRFLYSCIFRHRIGIAHKIELHLFDLSWTCCTATGRVRQIERMEFGPYSLSARVSYLTHRHLVTRAARKATRFAAAATNRGGALGADETESPRSR